MCVRPAKALRRNICAFRFNTDEVIIARAVGFTKCMAAANQRDRFFVIHRHAAKCIADIIGGSLRVGMSVRTLRVYIDEAHLHSGQRVFEIALTGVTAIWTAADFKPFCFFPPINIRFRLEDIFAPAGETKGLKAHRFHGDISGQDD